MTMTMTTIAAGALMFTAACSSGSTHTSTAATNPQPPAADMTTSAANLIGFGSTTKGIVLTGPNGHALYYYDKDTPTTVACTGSCTMAWPPLAGPATAEPGVNPAALGTVTGPGGTKQATYEGHPLYYYADDTKAGTATGDGEGGVWHVIAIPSSARPTTPMSGAPMSGTPMSGAPMSGTPSGNSGY
ncbi:MAG TPA: hypothetical protein VK816_00815 [Jatrophihabitantaceae bacterium]|nr:hypothetical protein [Jatrophihabitantaceae bacterium]